MSTLETPNTQVRKIGDLKPYWRNPRRIPPDAVAAVKSSLERYGYQQPIVIDREDVVVVGHTRLLAMQEMGVEEVEVYVTDLPPDKIREYRLIDNRTGEMSEWDHGSLVLELREFETSLIEEFFPHVDLEIETLADAMVTNAQVEQAAAKVLSVKESPQLLTTTIECPACFHRFQVRTDSLPGLSREDLVGMSQDGEPAE